ncbi:hypothetical protein EBZ37_09710 [bacterium]|nr:hypothetical protein [bacterium]
MMKKAGLGSKRRYALAFSLLLVVFVSGCAKVRDAKFPEGVGENIFETSLFTKSDMNLQTDSESGMGLFSKTSRSYACLSSRAKCKCVTCGHLKRFVRCLKT